MTNLLLENDSAQHAALNDTDTTRCSLLRLYLLQPEYAVTTVGVTVGQKPQAWVGL